MEFIRWHFAGVTIPMVSHVDTLFCTSKGVANGLGVSIDRVKRLYHIRPEEFESLSEQKSHAKEVLEFLSSHKKDFDIKRMRSDMHLWTDDDMITFAILSRSDKSREFRKALKDLIKQQAQKDMVSVEEFFRLEESHRELAMEKRTLEEKVATLCQSVEYLEDYLGVKRTQAGRDLQAQKRLNNVRAIIGKNVQIGETL